MSNIFAVIIYICIDILLTMLCSFLLFDAGVYMNTKIKKGKNFENFIMSKQLGFTEKPFNDLLALIFGGLLAFVYIFVHFYLAKMFAVGMIYLYLIPISFILGLRTDPNNILSITMPEVKIGRFKFPMAGLTKGSIINWSIKNYIVIYYNFLKKFIMVVVYFVFLFLFLFGIFKIIVQIVK
jgi:hypothetical protein